MNCLRFRYMLLLLFLDSLLFFFFPELILWRMSSKVLCPEIETSVNLVILRDVFAVSFYALYSTVRTFEKKFFRKF